MNRSMLLLFLLYPGSLFAGCLGAAWSELLIPGSGYAYSGQWGKALVFGGSRWAWTKEFVRTKESSDIIPLKDRFEVVPKGESDSGKTELIRTMNQSTQDQYTTFQWQLNTGFLSFWDLQRHDCQPNSEVWGASVAPFRVDQFGDKWAFWLGIAAVAGFLNSGVLGQNLAVRDTYLNGYTEKKHKQDIFLAMYPVGIGEEAIFRDSLQDSLYDAYLGAGWSPESARHLSIWSGTTIFALSHAGSSPTANIPGAFLLGAYNGYLYHPAVGEHDLITAMAFHTWFDTLYYLALARMATQEERETLQQPILKVGFQF